MKKHAKRKIISAVALIAVAACALVFVGCGDKSDNKKGDPPPCTHEITVERELRAPTCTDDGLSEYVCKECKTVVGQKTVEAIGHDYSQAEDSGKCKTCNAVICSPGMTYTLTDDGRGYILSDPDHHCGENVVIPEYHDGKPVVEIASDAFNSRTYIKSVSIPKTVEVINVGAFNGCNSLADIYYNAESAADFRGINWVFYYSGNVPQLSVTIGKNVKRIPGRLFYPHNANSGVIPYIKSLAFESGGKLEEIGEYAFYKTNLTACSFPDTLVKVGAHAFESSAVSELNFGPRLETVGAHAFDYCLQLAKVDLSATSLQTVEDSAFRNCGGLTEVALPDTLDGIGDKAFYCCGKLNKLALGGVRTVGAEAFYGCEKLGELTLPERLKTIGKSAFERCSGLTRITVKSTAIDALPAGNRAFYGAGASDGVEVVVSNSVRALPGRLFFSTADTQNNIKIKKLFIEVGVESIGENAFRGVTVSATAFAGTSAQYGGIEIADGNSAVGTPSFEAGRA